ncbi:MAG: hypothetical protein ABIR91_04355 [Candidatus Saccharimonadales bacterium]
MKKAAALLVVTALAFGLSACVGSPAVVSADPSHTITVVTGDRVVVSLTGLSLQQTYDYVETANYTTNVVRSLVDEVKLSDLQVPHDTRVKYIDNTPDGWIAFIQPRPMSAVGNGDTRVMVVYQRMASIPDVP